MKQSFSHGRSNTVVVEVKKRRILGRPGEAEAPKPEPVARAGAGRPRARAAPAPKPAARPLDSATARKELQEKLLREAEDARLSALEEARRREEHAGQGADRGREAPRRGQSPGRGGAPPRPPASPPRRKPAAPPSRRRSPPPPRRRRRRRRGRRAPPRPATPRPCAAAKRPEPARPTRGRDEHRRQRGKLTVTRALGEDGDARARSLAALSRSREKEKRAHQQAGPSAKQVRDVIVPEAITVQELANRMAERGADLVKALFKMGMPVTVNETIDQDTAELLVTEFGHNIKRVSEADVDIQTEEDVDAAETLQPRPPVVTIMGHVDHGKTSPARRDPRRRRRLRRGRRHHPAYRRLSGRPCPTSRRSPSSTRRATRPSPRCARAAPTSPTSSSWWWRPTTG